MDHRKQSLYFTTEILDQIKSEATRLDRSLSWTVQRAWKLAREEMAKIPSVDNSTPPMSNELPDAK